jgi:penicillin amidase
MDLYIEKIDPHNSNRYESKGRWIDMKVASDTIQVANNQPVRIKIRQTIHGPVISDSYSRLKDFHQAAKLPFPQSYAISLRWTALEPSRTFPAIWKMNVARTWSEFRAAAAQFDVPSQNMVYADVDGNIGYQMPGRVPIRNHGDGRYPVPGWTDEFGWKGYIPFDQLPTRFNPAAGFIATANNPVTDSSYPYLITQDWDYGFRARRIVEMIRAGKGFVHPEYVQRMQNDNKNFNAQFLVPLILKLPLSDPDLSRARELLRSWNFQQNRDSAAAALFETFWKYLLSETMQDDLPEWFKPGGGGRWVEIFRRLTADPNHYFWDDKRTKQREQRDAIMQVAFGKAVRELQESLGRNPEKWKWGSLHTTTFHNQTLGKSGLRLLEKLLNRGPFPTSGGTAVVNATAWDASESFEVTDLPSMRMIVDFSNFDQSMTVNTTGQSGHAFQSNYADLAGMWRDGKYYPMYFTRNAVEQSAKNLLLLVP